MRRTTALIVAALTALAVPTMIAGAAHAAGGSHPSVSVAEPVPIADPTITSPETEAVTGPSPTFEGTGEPGADLELFISGTSVGTTTIGEDGTWTLPVPGPLGHGEHVGEAVQTVDGDVRSTNVIFHVPPPPPILTSPADGSTTTDATPTIAGTGTPGLPIVVEIDGEPYGYDGGYDIIVADDGTWSYVTPRDLACGEHTVRALQPEPSGGTSSSSPSATFTVTCTEEQAGPGDDGATGSTGNQAGPPPGDVLPATGSPAELGLLAALGAILVGLGAHVLRRGFATDMRG